MPDAGGKLLQREEWKPFALPAMFPHHSDCRSPETVNISILYFIIYLSLYFKHFYHAYLPHRSSNRKDQNTVFYIEMQSSQLLTCLHIFNLEDFWKEFTEVNGDLH